MTRRIFPEVLHQREAFKEAKQEWLNTMKAETNCLFSQSEPCICHHLKERLVKLFLAVIAESFQMHNNMYSSFSVRMDTAGKGPLARKQGDSRGTRQKSTTSQVPYLHGSSEPEGDLCGTFALIKRSVPAPALSPGYLEEHRNTALPRAGATDEACKTKTKLLAKSWILPLLLGLQGSRHCAYRELCSLLSPAFIIDGGSVPAVIVN